MTVAELIVALHTLDSDLNVYAGTAVWDIREVIGARKDHDVACNDMICHYAHIQLGDTP